MPKWIDTKWATFSFGYNYEDGYYTPNSKILQEKLDWLANDLSFAGYEIKSVTPLTTSIAHSNVASGSIGHGGYGWGYGWGISQITGMAVLMQKIEEISDEEYKLRLNRRKLYELKNSKDEIEASLPKLKAAVEANAWISTNIVEKKGLMGGISYNVAEHRRRCNDVHKFKTRQDAEAHVQTILAVLAIPKAELDKALNKLKELEDLENEFATSNQSDS